MDDRTTNLSREETGMGSLDDTPADAQSLGLSVFKAIKKDILYADLKPNEQLRLRVLCDRYGCGASPIREALNQLASDGWVVRIDKRGFFVAPTSQEEFQDILSNRCFLDSEALRRSIAQGDGAWEEAIVLAHYRLSRVPRAADSEQDVINREWEAAHKAFHMALISACGSPILFANCEKLYDLNIRYRFQARQISQKKRAIVKEHDDLKDLALAHSADEAAEALIKHYRKTGRFLFQTDDDGGTYLPEPHAKLAV